MEIVKIKFLNDQGEATGRSYSYFAEEPLGLGEVVQVPVTGRGDLPSEHMVKSVVVEVNVPEAEIAAFRDRVKTIPSGSKRPPTQAADFIPATEVQFPEAETPPVAQVASLFDPPADQGPSLEERIEDHLAGIPRAVTPGPRRCDVEHLRDYPECFEECGKDECDGEPYTPQDEGPTEGEHVEQLWAESKAAEEGLFDTTGDAVSYPSSLTVIEHKFGPPTSMELFKLYHEAAGLLDFAKKRAITTNADLKPAADDLAIILQCRKSMEARKAELVGPMRAELDKFYQAFNDLMAPVLEAEKLTKSKVAAFDNEQRRKSAAAARIEEEKTRLAREEAALNGTGEITVPLGTAEAPPPVPDRTRTDMGTMYGRDNWKAKVVDFAALPDEFKLADMSALNAKAKSSKGTAVIPGVEFFNDRTFQSRTK